MNELARLAAEAVGAKCCVKVEKCPDGFYNKSFLLTMEDGRQVIGKLPNPNAGQAHYTTASEVATMDFGRNVLGIPIPQVFAWNSRADDNPVGAEYIIMAKVPGVQLESVWRGLSLAEKFQLVMTVARYQTACMSISFSKIGSLYYTQDLGASYSQSFLYVDSDGRQIRDPRFAVGPAMGREWIDEGRATVKCDRGPWDTPIEYRMAIGHREIACVKEFPRFPKPLVMLCGPGTYQPTAGKKLSALQSYLSIVEYMLPQDSSIASSHLWHDDLHAENIFVDPDKPTEIVGIIDWQSVQLVPLVDHTLQPAFLNYEGPGVEGLEPPQLPANVNELGDKQKATAVSHYMAASIVFAFRKWIHAKNERLYKAMEFNNSESANVLWLSRRIFEVGEATFLALVADMKDIWVDLPGVRARDGRPFPLQFSDIQLKEIQADVEGALRGHEIMNKLRETMGDLWPDKGVVAHHQYDAVKNALRELKKEILSKLANTKEERAAWEDAWPFDD